LLTILGGGGWLPAFGRHTATALLRDGEHAVMIDAGTGVARFTEREDLLAGVRRLDILLSHFHLDHIAGLAYLPAIAGLCEQTTIWGPGRLLYGVSTAELLDRISHEPFHPVPLEQQEIAVDDIPAGELELPGRRVAVRRQDQHSAPSLGFRFEDQLTWITDTAYDPGSARFAAGCRVLAHEAWFVEAEPRNAAIHTSARDAARIALDAGAEQLLLIHLPPFSASVDPIVQEATSAAAGAVAALDGFSLDL
jgi:ribonuclease BN (tRNA processing enzyme)